MSRPMTFRQAEDHLLGLELFGMRFGLDRMRKLTTALGTPQRTFESIHVVGSNGKSSTVRFIAAILERHGLRTGAYTSPHLRSFRERIEVGETPVSEADFAAAVARSAHAASLVDRTAEPDDRVTQFETLTAAALSELARRDVEVAVIEAGLGGRFDATNVIASRVQVLTTVGLEHTRWLGPTARHVAEEKLAVVEPGGTLVVGELDPEIDELARRVARERGARLIRAPGAAAERARGEGLPAGRYLAGAYQRRNFALAAAAATAFLGRALERDAVDRAAGTRVPGRLDRVSERPLTILDGAHNPAGARALAEALDEVLGARRPRVGVIAVLDDKDATAMLAALLPELDHVIFTRSANPRSLPPATLASLAGKLAGDQPSDTAADPREALHRARALAGPHGAVIATGSIYLIADLVRREDDARASTL